VDSDYLYVVSRIPLRAETVSRWAKADKISRLPAPAAPTTFPLGSRGLPMAKYLLRGGLVLFKKAGSGSYRAVPSD
jgi:hypothetical protein